MPFSRAHSARTAAARRGRRRSGAAAPSPYAARVAATAAATNRPMSTLVARFSGDQCAAGCRRSRRPRRSTRVGQQVVEHGAESSVGRLGRVRLGDVARTARPLVGVGAAAGRAGRSRRDDAVLDVVHRVGHVVGPVHDLRLQAAPAPAAAPAPQPVEDRRRRRRTPRTCAGPRRRGHGYLQDGVQAARVRLSPAERAVRRRGPWPPAGSAPAASARCPRSRRRPAAAASSASSPLCPNGGWPRSCARPAVSTTSGSQPRRAPISRAICATSSEWVSRVRRNVVGRRRVCTWVLAASRRNAGGVQHPGPVALERAAPAVGRAGRGRPSAPRRRSAPRPGHASSSEVCHADPRSRGRWKCGSRSLLTRRGPSRLGRRGGSPARRAASSAAPSRPASVTSAP